MMLENFLKKTLVHYVAVAITSGCVGANAATPAVIYVPGFQTFKADQYIVDAENLSALKLIKENSTPFKISGFTTSMKGDNWLVCRMSFPVYPPGKVPYQEFLAEAMRAELVEAGLYSAESKFGIRGHIVSMDFSSFGSGKWTIEARFEADQKDPITIKHEYSFSLSILATKSCENVTNALVPAIQGFLNTVYKDERFAALLSQDPQTPAVRSNEVQASK
jgi:hypothetical protein